MVEAIISILFIIIMAMFYAVYLLMDLSERALVEAQRVMSSHGISDAEIFAYVDRVRTKPKKQKNKKRRSIHISINIQNGGNDEK